MQVINLINSIIAIVFPIICYYLNLENEKLKIENEKLKEQIKYLQEKDITRFW